MFAKCKMNLLSVHRYFIFVKNVELGNKTVGDSHPCYFVAEIGGLFKNFEEAKRLIDDVVEIGIDAVKFQTLEAETITTKNNYFDMEVTGKVSQYDFFKKFEPSKELQMQIVKYANEHGVTIFSAPSHIKDLELMKKMDLPIYKIGSDLACHIPLLKEVAKLGKPIILSTGMCTMEEVRNSVDAVLSSGNEQLVLLHCVSDYPAKIEEVNLNAILSMKKEFNLPVGFSDHTTGTLISLAATAIGANLIERHFHSSKNSPSPDDIHSLDKHEFKNLIESARLVEKSRGDGKKLPSKTEQRNLLANRVSIVSTMNIPHGTVITSNMVDIRRPGTGLQPIHFQSIMGKKTKRNILSEEPISWDMIE